MFPERGKARQAHALVGPGIGAALGLCLLRVPRAPPKSQNLNCEYFRPARTGRMLLPRARYTLEAEAAATRLQILLDSRSEHKIEVVAVVTRPPGTMIEAEAAAEALTCAPTGAVLLVLDTRAGALATAQEFVSTTASLSPAPGIESGMGTRMGVDPRSPANRGRGRGWGSGVPCTPHWQWPALSGELACSGGGRAGRSRGGGSALPLDH